MRNVRSYEQDGTQGRENGGNLEKKVTEEEQAREGGDLHAPQKLKASSRLFCISYHSLSRKR